jgi:hypothetical protein
MSRIIPCDFPFVRKNRKLSRSRADPGRRASSHLPFGTAAGCPQICERVFRLAGGRG